MLGPTRGEHANSTQNSPRQLTNSNSGSCCCAVTIHDGEPRLQELFLKTNLKKIIQERLPERNQAMFKNKVIPRLLELYKLMYVCRQFSKSLQVFPIFLAKHKEMVDGSRLVISHSKDNKYYKASDVVV